MAFDHQTARGLWYCDGYISDKKGNTEIMYHKVAVDFVREGNSFKIWHLVFGIDVVDPLHTDVLGPTRGAFGDIPEWFGNPTVACITHDPAYNWNDNYPAEPEPYESYDIRNSYAPDGCPRYRKYLREVKKHEKR